MTTMDTQGTNTRRSVRIRWLWSLSLQRWQAASGMRVRAHLTFFFFIKENVETNNSDYQFAIKPLWSTYSSISCHTA